MCERKRHLLILMMIAFVSFTLSMSTPTSSASVIATLSSNQPRTFTVIVSRNGFNGTSSGFNITVQQGDSVKITFIYGDGDLSVDNPHAIAFEGYGIKTASFGKSNPTVTVEFVADVSGTFMFYCNIPCLGMANLLGHLVVAETQAPRSETTLSLKVASTSAESDSFLISATVKDVSGKPLVAVPVKFYENTTFGKLLLNTMPTNSLGVATLNYTASRVGSIQIIAENSGNTKYGKSQAALFITVPSRIADSQTEAKIYLGLRRSTQGSGVFYGISYPPNLSMIAVPRVMNIITVILAGIVVVGVWSTYVYVWRQMASLPRHGEPLQEVVDRDLSINMPLEVGPSLASKITEGTDKIYALLILAPLLGFADMLVVNSLAFSITWRVLALAALAVLETLAVVAIITGQNATE